MTEASRVEQPFRIEAPDPRSDSRQRIIEISSDAVVIRRGIAGISMTVRVAMSSYRGISLRITAVDEGAFRYQVLLRHEDPDLSVLLVDTHDREKAERDWRNWVRQSRLPALIEKSEGLDVAINIAETDLSVRIPYRRAKTSGVRSRGRFQARRKLTGGMFASISRRTSNDLALDRNPD